MDKKLIVILLGCSLTTVAYASKPILDEHTIDIISPFSTETTRLIPITSRPYKPSTTTPEEYDSDADDPFRTHYQRLDISNPVENSEHHVIIYPSPEDNPNYVAPTCKEKCCLVAVGAGLSLATAGTITAILWFVSHV